MSPSRPPPSGPIALQAPWGSVPRHPGEPVHRVIGPREFWFDFPPGEIRLAHQAHSTEVPGSWSAPPEDPRVWSRWALPSATETVALELRPALPSRAVIVQPEVPFALLPGAEARVFVRIPLQIRVELSLPESSSRDPIPLMTLPTLELSDTWWGDFLEGELCSWLPTTARREFSEALLEPHLVICPLLLSNGSRIDLQVEKLCFRVEHLSLFSDRNGFWSDESRVHYEGDAEGSEIEMTGAAPREARDPQRISAPVRPVRGFRALTFNRLRSLSGFGGSA